MASYRLIICDRIREKGPLGAERQLLVGHTTVKYSSWAYYCTLFCVCSCFHCWDMHIWKLRFVYVHARLFEPIVKIVALRKVGPFLKSCHICMCVVVCKSVEMFLCRHRFVPPSSSPVSSGDQSECWGGTTAIHTSPCGPHMWVSQLCILVYDDM